MGLLSALVTWPLAPVRGVGWIGEQIRREAERQYYDPAAIQEQLDQLEDARAQGLITDEEADAIEDDLVQRLLDGGSYG
jgi:hypothetical protein